MKPTVRRDFGTFTLKDISERISCFFRSYIVVVSLAKSNRTQQVAVWTRLFGVITIEN